MRDDALTIHAACYRIFLLGLAEPHPDVRSAIARENQLKKCRRALKIDLTQRTNPDREDRRDMFNP